MTVCRVRNQARLRPDRPMKHADLAPVPPIHVSFTHRLGGGAHLPWKCIRSATSSRWRERSISRAPPRSAMSPSPRSPAPSASSKASLAAICSAASGHRPSSPSSASACCRCLKQCYESALSARSLASAIKKGEVGSLRLALSRTIDPSLVTPHVVELGKLFQGLELKLLRGTGKRGARVSEEGRGRARPRRPDRRGMGAARQLAVVHRGFSALRQRDARFLRPAPSVMLDDLRQERLMVRTYCETTPEMLDLLRMREFDVTRFHEVSADGDLICFARSRTRRGARAAQHAEAPTACGALGVEGFEIKRTSISTGSPGGNALPWRRP